MRVEKKLRKVYQWWRSSAEKQEGEQLCGIYIDQPWVNSLIGRWAEPVLDNESRSYPTQRGRYATDRRDLCRRDRCLGALRWQTEERCHLVNLSQVETRNILEVSAPWRLHRASPRDWIECRR
jgi:hypothetical protein